MTVLSALSAYQGPVVLLLVILGPTILRPAFLLRLIGRGPPRASPRAPRSPITLPAKLLLALHTLYRLHSLARPPYNIFTTHHLPIYASNDILRRHVLPHLASSSSTLSRFDAPSSQLELLLAKLAQLDNRILYSRYGHQPLSSCTWCHSSTDYLIAALPGVLQAYITMAWLVGMLGLRPIGGGDATVRKRAWRGSMCWILAVLAVGELGVRYLWEIRISEGDAIQLDSIIHTLRTILFLVIPLTYLFLPLPATTVQTALPPLLASLQNTTQTLRLSSLARTAALRDAGLRDKLVQSTEEEGALRAAGRADIHVQRSAESLGLKEGMSDSARRWIDEGWAGLVRIGPQPG